MKSKSLLYSMVIGTLLLCNFSACASIHPTSTSTIPPFPTLEKEQKLKLVEDLLTNNAHCKLPCWWGLTPGTTQWQAAQRFLETFSRDIYSFNISETIFLHRVIIPVPEHIFHQELSQNYTEYNGVIESIEIFPGRTTVYGLSNTLTAYGLPSEIWMSWINTKPNQRGYVPMFVMLFYQNQGIMMEYSPNKLSVSEKTVTGCPQEEEYPELFLWSPELEMGKSFTQILNQTELDGKGLQYLSLEEASGISVEAFYNTFKNVDNTECLETRIELWPKGKEPFE